MAKRLPKNVAAVPDMKGQPEDVRYPILGNLVWYSLRDVRISRQDLAKLFVKYNLPATALPFEIKEVDAFRRATSDMGTKASRLLPDGTYEILMVRDVASTPTEVVRWVMREIRDSQNVKLDYRQAGTFIFRRDINDFVAHALEPRFQGICDEAQDIYKEYTKYYTGKAVRDAVHNLVYGTLPTVVRQGGGVYFMSKEHQALIDGLTGLVKELNAYGVAGTLEAEFESIPVLDTKRQRLMLFEKYSSMCAKSVDDTLQELSVLLNAEKVPSNKVKAGYVEIVNELKAGIGKYEQLLELDLVAARQKTELLNSQVLALLDKTEVDNKSTPALAEA